MFSPSSVNANLGELFQQLMCAKNILDSFEFLEIYQKNILSPHLNAQILLFLVQVY